MRIAALHLIAYGPFTDCSLVFGSDPGFHIIYGDNEAGKSTTLRALSSVLFGYPHEVVDGYKHDTKDIVLGAELIQKDGETLSLQRRRRGKNALARSDGTALDEAAVSKILGGTSKVAFEMVFALDHRRLHEHARALLAEGGSLGFTLAAAGSGLAGLKSTLDQMKAERATLFLPSGSKPALNQKIGQLTELRKEVRKRQVSLAEFKKRQKEIDEVESALAEARAQDHALAAETVRLERIARNLPLRAQHVAASNRLASLAAVPLLTPDATQQRIKAETDKDAAEIDLKQAEEALAALEREATDIALDTAVLEKTAEIEALSEKRGAIESADKSLPRRDAERAQHYETVRDLLTKAEIQGEPTELGTLLPSLVKRKQVSVLADKGRGLVAQEETLKDTVSNANEAVRLANERFAATEAPANTSALNTALHAADDLGDIHAEVVKRTRVQVTKVKTTREGIVSLGLEQGEAAFLRKLNVPSDETVARCLQDLTTVEAEEREQTAAKARLKEELQGIERRIEELALGGVVATKEELDAIRTARDAVWTILRGVYVDRKSALEEQAEMLACDGDLAGAFELKMAEADGTADSIIAHSKEAAELSLSMRRKAEIEGKIAALEIKNESIREQRAALDADWKTLWPSEVKRIQPPAEMAVWLKRREILLDEDFEQQNEAGAIASLEAKELEAREGLLVALEPFAAVTRDTPLTQLRIRSRGIIDAATTAATAYAKAAEAVKNAELRKREADAAHARISNQTAEWSRAWTLALRDAGMKDSHSIEAAATILEIMTALDTLKPQIDELTHRIETMSHDKREFEAAVDELGPLVSGFVGMAATEVSRHLNTRLKTAKAAEAEVHRLRDQQRIREEAKRKASERLARSTSALAALCITAGCEDPGALADIERRSASKQETIRERETLEARMLEGGAGLSLEALMAECEGMDGDSLPGDIAALKAERGELGGKIENMMAERARFWAAFEALFGEKQAAEALQNAANVEAEIGRLTQRYSDLALQEVVLRQAIDLYRERNQGPIIDRAKTLFAELTNGAYSGLRADVDEKDEVVLIAEHSTRGSLEVKSLSDGTVDALYLALRLAAVQVHNTTKEPLPFVADDLLLSLDNTRAESTLRALGVLAETSQVLFFTHHKHMVALACAILPRSILTEHRL